MSESSDNARGRGAGSAPEAGTDLPPAVFVIRHNEQVWGSLFADEVPPSRHAIADKFINATDCWIAQTYIELRRRGHPVRASPTYIRGAINITSAEQLALRDLPLDCFLVVCRHDRGEQPLAHHVICQCRQTADGVREHYIPHWPQPGLMPREVSRGTRIETIAFRGTIGNLDEGFRNGSFVEALGAMGCKLEIGDADYATRFAAWTDYRNVDVTLAVRNLTHYDASVKPPSKLFNAWLAGTPALLGPEPSFREYRLSDLDFIEVCSPAEALDAIRRLKDDPSLYGRMLSRCVERRSECDDDRMVEAWRRVLGGPVRDGWKRWRRQWLRPVRSAIAFPGRARSHQREQAKHVERVVQGPRLFDSRR